MLYNLRLYGSAEVRQLIVYFCDDECAFECFTGLAIIERVLDRMVFMADKLQKIREAMQRQDVEEAERLSVELLQDLEEEKTLMKAELEKEYGEQGLDKEVEGDSEEESLTDDAEYVNSFSSESDENYDSDRSSAGQSKGWLELMKRLRMRRENS